MTITINIGFWMAPISFVVAAAFYLCYAAVRDGEPDVAGGVCVIAFAMVFLMLATRFLP